MSDTSGTVARCAICGEPMPPGEQMFKYHGFSGDCPKPPLPRPSRSSADRALGRAVVEERLKELAHIDPHGIEFGGQPYLRFRCSGWDGDCAVMSVQGLLKLLFPET